MRCAPPNTEGYPPKREDWGSEGVVLARGRCFALEAAARKDREHCILRVELQRRALLDSRRIFTKQVGWELGVPEASHLIVLLVKVAVELVLQQKRRRFSTLLADLQALHSQPYASHMPAEQTVISRREQLLAERRSKGTHVHQTCSKG